MDKQKVLMVKCPQCKKSFNYHSVKSKPFCSDRCRMVDLGKWLNEEYSVSAPINILMEEEDGKDHGQD